MVRLTSYCRWTYELSFSLYCALLVVTWEAWKPTGSSFLRILEYPLNKYLFPALVKLNIHLSPFGVFSHSALLWYILAIVLLLVFHNSTQLATTRKWLHMMAGVISVAGFPALWLHMGSLEGLSPTVSLYLLLETALSVVFVLLYSYGASQIDTRAAIVLLTIHFGIWGGIAERKLSVGFWLIYVLLSICTVLAWAVYGKRMGKDSAKTRNEQ